MVGSAEAHELEEEIGSVDASVGDLVGSEEAGVMARITWDFRPSLMTEEMIEELEKEGCFAKGKGGLRMARQFPGLGSQAVVVKDFFACGLRFPAVRFLQEVLENFKVQLHHLTPNGILTLSKFCWAYESYGSEPDLDTFCEYYKL